MTIKEIWKKFIEDAKDCLADSWFEIRKIAKSTFDLLKIAIIDLIKAIYNWLVSLIEGVATIIYNFIKIVGLALISAIKSTLGILVDKLIEWVKKW